MWRADGIDLFPARRRELNPAFIKAMHPKTEIKPQLASIEKILDSGWVGQTKIHGHRAQIHIHADAAKDPVAYTRQGSIHKKLLPPEIIKELRRILRLEEGWTAIDSEWLKNENKLFIFDVLKLNDKVLGRMTYPERWKLLPRSYISRYIQTLPLLHNTAKCLEVLNAPEEYIEGLVFKSLNSVGFKDTAIIRCRKRPA
jgi:ATP-dependent DNA ligase